MSSLEWSQEDRIPRGLLESTVEINKESSWMHVELETGIWVSVYGIPMVDPADVVGEEDNEISIELKVNLELRPNSYGVNFELFNTRIGTGLWTEFSPETNGNGRTCMGTSDPDKVTISLSAQEFFQIRQAKIDSDPGWLEGTVSFFIFPLGNAATCGGGPLYRDSKAKVNLRFKYKTFTPLPIDLKLWDEDLCQNMVMTPTYSPNSIFPSLLSTHTTRAMAKSPTPTEEVCKHHTAEVVIGSDGYARAFYCGKSWAQGDETHQRNYYADPYIVQDKDTVLGSQVPKGMACFLGSYHAPKWTEAQLWSHKFMCKARI